MNFTPRSIQKPNNTISKNLVNLSILDQSLDSPGIKKESAVHVEDVRVESTRPVIRKTAKRKAVQKG